MAASGSTLPNRRCAEERKDGEGRCEAIAEMGGSEWGSSAVMGSSMHACVGHGKWKLLKRKRNLHPLCLSQPHHPVAPL